VLTSWTSPAQAAALPIAVALPLLACCAVLLLRRRPNARETASVICGLLLAAVVLTLWPMVDRGLQFELWTWLPGLSLKLALEPLGLLFATVAAVLWPVTTVFALGYLRAEHDRAQTRFFAFFSLTIEGLGWYSGEKMGWIDPHNSHLNIAYKTGIVGFFVFLLIMIRFFVRTMRLLRRMRRDDKIKLYIMGLLVCCVHVLIVALFVVVLEGPYLGAFLWIAMGLIVALENIYKRKYTEIPE